MSSSNFDDLDFLDADNWPYKPPAPKVRAAPSMENLYKSLSQRSRPEDILKDILALENGLIPTKAKSKLKIGAASGHYYSYMSDEFRSPDPLTISANSLAKLMGVDLLKEEETKSPPAIGLLLDQARSILAMKVGQTNFKTDRLNSEMRSEQGLTFSRRRYNKLFRLVGRLEKESLDLERQIAIYQSGLVAKTSFASSLSLSEFEQDPLTAFFVAYMTANLGRRSQFMIGPQARSFDSLAQLLFWLLEANLETNWYAVAHVFPREDVLAKLTPEQKVPLLSLSLGAMFSSADLLKKCWESSDINLKTMVVHKGNDSTTWNALAGAFNRSRDYWIGLLSSLGRQDTFEHFLPGKVLRLIAHDVYRWHEATGGKLHGDTGVWSVLPKPWEVLYADAVCTQAMIEDACQKCGLSSTKSGWSAARSRTQIDLYQPTPELVHGVSVGDPKLAAILRRAGFYSGKGPSRTI